MPAKRGHEGARLFALGVPEVDHAVLYLLASGGLDGRDQRLQTGGSPREAAGESDEQSVVVASAGAVFRCDVREVANVLREHAVAAGDRRAEHLWIGRARETKLRDRGRIDPDSPKRCGHSGRVHLVDEDLHRVSAAAVSLR